MSFIVHKYKIIVKQMDDKVCITNMNLTKNFL
jgi:hypothetical protein